VGSTNSFWWHNSVFIKQVSKKEEVPEREKGGSKKRKKPDREEGERREKKEVGQVGIPSYLVTRRWDYKGKRNNRTT